MKPTDFLPEKHTIGQAAIDMHVDHEIQMAREECYHAATNAMELHRMLKHVSEQEGLQAWASEKITLANDYLRTVKEWLEYEIMNKLEQGVAEQNPAPVIAAPAPVGVAIPEPEILENDERKEGPSMQATHRARLSRERGSERELGRDPRPTGQWYLLINGSAYKKDGSTVYFNSSAEATRIGGKINEFRKSKGWRPARMEPIEQKGMEEMTSGATGGGAIAIGALGGSKMFKRTTK